MFLMDICSGIIKKVTIIIIIFLRNVNITVAKSSSVTV